MTGEELCEEIYDGWDVKVFAGVQDREQRLEILRNLLRQLATYNPNEEWPHRTADELLCAFIEDPEVTKLFNAMRRMYA